MYSIMLQQCVDKFNLRQNVGTAPLQGVDIKSECQYQFKKFNVHGKTNQGQIVAFFFCCIQT